MNFVKCKELKTLWQMEKLLALSNFTFSHNVFKSPLLQRRQKASIWGKGLNMISHNYSHPFPETDALWHICSSLLFKTLGEIALYKHIFHLPQCFQFFALIIHSFKELYLKKAFRLMFASFMNHNSFPDIEDFFKHFAANDFWKSVKVFIFKQLYLYQV